MCCHGILLSSLFNAPVPPGPGSVVRKVLLDTVGENSEVRGFVVRSALREENLFSSLTQREIGSGRDRTAQRGRSLVSSSCSCSYAYGQGTAVGPHTGERCWPLLVRLWKAVAPLMQPWCAEGEV